jgi:hypothetical protein
MKHSLARSLAGLVAAGLLLTGCGDDASEETATAPDTAAQSAEASPAGEDPTEEVTAAYDTFYTTFEPASLEDGEDFAADLPNSKASSVAAGGVAADVKSVKALDETGCEEAGVISPCAEVEFDLLVAGNPAVPDQTGYAVQQDGEWKVAKATFCALSSAGSNPPKACSS